MTAQTQTKNSRSWIFWLVLVLVLAAIWWWKLQAEQESAARGTSVVMAELEGADADEILLDLKDDLTDAEVAALGARHALDLVLVSDQSRDERLYRAVVKPAQRDAILTALLGEPGVEVAEPDATYSLLPFDAVPALDAPARDSYPNDPQYKFQWHMEAIHVRDAWQKTKGEGVIVAVIDTGVAYEAFEGFHRVEDLEASRFVPGFDFVGNDAHPNDDHGHGTHVAGTIAQTTHNGVGVAGVAPHAKIMPLKVLGAGGSGSIGGIADAIHFAADNGAKVINMSLGGPFSSKILERAVKYARDKGVIVVCAAGNDGRSRVSYPAKYPGSFAVAATQFDGATTFYSNWGKEIAIAAPGGNTRVDQNGDGMPDGVLQNTIETANPAKSGYFGYMGTSMAAPHVAGVAALVIAAGVKDVTAVEAILRETARVPEKKTPDMTQRYGAGVVDAGAAVAAAGRTQSAWPLGIATLLGVALLASARRRSAVSVGTGHIGGLLLGAAGLGFVPWISDLLATSPFAFLNRGFPGWDISISCFSSVGSPLFASALVPVLGFAGLWGVKRLRPWLAGFSVGVAGYLLFQGAAGLVDVRWMPFDGAWLVGQGAIAAFLGSLAIRRA